ncbi:MAG: hypothetical protein HUJ91_07000 [Bacteroidales bacterium]|nr:hypothetical protein [Bacteroidales bacterium]
MNPFALAYREQQQLFLYDKGYLAATLLKAGGLSTLISRFIVQFFWNPVIALVVTALLLALSSYMLWAFARTSRRDWRSLALCLVPACFVGASLSDNSLHFDFLISLILIEAGLVIYKNIPSRKIFYGILITVVLYAAAGPASLIFALCALIYVSGDGFPSFVRALTIPAVAVVSGLVSYMLGGSPTLGHALTPAFHYNLDTAAPLSHWTAWVSIPAVYALSRLKNRKIILPAGIVLFAVSLISANAISRKIERKSNITGFEYEYYTVNERWDDLVQSCRRHVWSPGTANYMNLALAYKGKLTENIIRLDNRGVSSLLLIPEASSVDVRVAHIMFAMGNFAAAQNVAFNAMFCSEGYSPSMLKMNAQIELMRGDYDVADKYLSLLSKSLHYKKWAQAQRRFLWDEKAVAEDAFLSCGRKDFNLSDGFAMHVNPIDEVMLVVEANPYDKRAMDYTLSFLLLSKDIAKIHAFVDKYWGVGALETLPPAVQEALVFYSEYSRNFEGVEPVSIEWCLSHGVSPSIVQKFNAFQTASLKSNGAAPSGYRDTYWNYLLYKQL